MRTLDQVVHAIGSPRVLREVRVGPKMVAAVARWRHGGAFIPLSSADAYQIIFNISGGHRVEFHAQSNSFVRQILPGSIGFNVPDPTAAVNIIGEADALQIFLARDWIEDVTGCWGASSTLLQLAHEPQFRSAAAQALVAIERRGPGCEVELVKIISAVAARFAQHAPLSTKYKGGLSPGAHRRISKLIDDWLTAGTETLPHVEMMASVAGLSIHHFIKSFRGTTGQTPSAYLMCRRLQRAVELLLQNDARVDQISDQTGFSSPAHFVSTFRRHMGVTPGALRDAAVIRD
jgi:AraC-like DNA-binding protein